MALRDNDDEETPTPKARDVPVGTVLLDHIFLPMPHQLHLIFETGRSYNQPSWQTLNSCDVLNRSLTP